MKSPDCFYIKATADFRPPNNANNNNILSSSTSSSSCCDTNSGSSSQDGNTSSDETSNSREVILNKNKNLPSISSGSSASSGYHRGASEEHTFSTDFENDEWFYINKGDIFQVTHTHYKKSKKKWRATKIYEPHNILNDKIIKMGSGVIPSSLNFNYERVCLRKPQFKRPIVIFSPFYEVVSSYLSNKRHGNQFRNILDIPINPIKCENLLFNQPETLLADIIKNDKQHSMLTLSSFDNLENFNKITGLYPICVCVRSAYWEHVERIFNGGSLSFPDNVISRIEFCMNIEYELEHDQVIVVDVEGDELDGWKEKLIPRIREEQKKYVWIAHDNSDVVLPIETINKGGVGGVKASSKRESRASRASTATKALTMI